MKTALFTNFTTEEFIGYWDGKGKKFESGASLYMPDYLAAHFAKHLVNRELMRRTADGSLVHKDGEKYVSPKSFDLTDSEKMKTVPLLFMEMFNKAYTPDDMEQLGEKKDDIDTLINVANKNRDEEKESPANVPNAQAVPVQADTKPETEPVQDPTQPQIIVSPDFNEEDDGGEETFGGSPQDSSTPATN